MTRLTRESLAVRIETLLDEYPSEDFRDSLCARVGFRDGATQFSEALLVLLEALEKSKLAIEALATTQKRTGLGVIGGLIVGSTAAREIDDALARAADLLGMKGGE